MQLNDHMCVWKSEDRKPICHTSEDLLRELKKVIPTDNSTPKIHCTVFEDIKGCIDHANSQKFMPRTEHIALKILCWQIDSYTLY